MSFLLESFFGLDPKPAHSTIQFAAGIGVTCQGVGSRGATQVASVRSC